MKQSKRIFPYFLMLGLGFITLLILNAGFKMLEDQDARKKETEKSDEAQQILGTLAKGYEFDFHLTLAVRSLKTQLRKALANDKAAASFKIEKLHWSPKNFPAHDLWVFANDNQSFKTIVSPKNVSISRRGIAKAFKILAGNRIQKTNDKLLDYFFGPGQKVKYMALRKGLPTRVIYKKAPHLMLWDSIKNGNETAGGFFVLVPLSQKLIKYAMQTTADKLNFAAKQESGINSRQNFAGYIRIFNDADSSIFPDEMLDSNEFNDFFAKWKKPARLVEFETQPLPWA